MVEKDAKTSKRCQNKFLLSKRTFSQLFQVNFLVFPTLLVSTPVAAQITPDGTVETEVTQTGNVTEITGGEQAGGNLFHSFNEFSVPQGSEAFFNNSADIDNIINRVTGGSISNIDGLIRANGSANLFLINPAGIIFGNNARLDLGGSFLGSTADSLLFPEGEFSATDTQTKPLITINAPIGLNFRDNPGAIVNQSPVNNDVTFSNRLEVSPEQTLALIGGDVLIEGGFLAGGKIEIGSVAGNTTVDIRPLSNGWDFKYEGVENFQDINFTRAALVFSVKGDIQIQGRQVSFAEDSEIVTSSFENQLGNVLIKASELVELKGTNLGASSNIFPVPIGNDPFRIQNIRGEPANITIETKNLIVQDGARVLTSTFGEPDAGNLTVIASESVLIRDNGGLFARAEESSRGNGGDLSVTTGKLIVENEATISAETFGDGDAGNVNLNVNQLIVRNDATVTAANQGLGNGGDLFITAESLTLDNNASILATTDSGQGGNVAIEVDGILKLKNNSSIEAGAFEEATGGNIDIDAELIIASPSQKPNDGNDIIAFAEEESGGNINITTEALFSLEVRTATSGNGTNDISAARESRGFTNPINLIEPESPESTIDSAEIVAQVCSGERNRVGSSSFTIKGKGGVPPELTAPLVSDTIELEGEQTTRQTSEKKGQIATWVEPQEPLSPDDIVPARGAIVLENGDVILTAYPTPNAIPPIPTNSANCN